MEEYEIDLAMKMLSYVAFGSTEAQDLKVCDVKYHLRFFFTQEVMDEAQRRLTTRST